jgi:hypothetical protein
VIGGWRKLHDLYCSLDIVRVVGSRNMRWANMWHMVGAGKEKCVRILVGNLRERDCVEDLGVDGRIILE